MTLEQFIIRRNAFERRLSQQVLTGEEHQKFKYKIELLKELISEEVLMQTYKELRKRSRVSLKRGTILKFEELILSDDNKSREDYILAKVIDLALLEFADCLGNEKKKLMTSLEDTHPKKPCIQYENNGRKKAQYKLSLDFLIKNMNWLMLEEPHEKIEESFKVILEDVKKC